VSGEARNDHGLQDSSAERGWRDYNRGLLAVYDRVVIGFVAKAVWRCPPETLLGLYRANIRAPHLDVGPGTGFAIDRSGLPDGSAVTLVDPNPTVLAYATRRLRRLDVAAVRASVLEPLPIELGFPSAGLNVVLHCLPGPMARKAAAIRNIASVLAPDGVLFGSTVLGLAGDQTRLSRAVLRLFNRRGAFDNLGDTEDGLRIILDESFENVDLSVVGAVAIFVARRPRRAGERTPGDGA
jgi:SAM-dependent methyltransferase